METLKFLDLKAGQELPRGKVRSVQLMTNGSVRVYYEAPTDDVAFEVKAPISGESDYVFKSEDYENVDLRLPGPMLEVVDKPKSELAEKKRLESDMASGKGSKRGK